MKLVKQTRLHFQEGTSDKVYEVDLCEVSPGSYVVNFRYGRRGATLKESAKTTAPVPLGQAEKLFAELVASKTKKGYHDAAAAAGTASEEWGATRLKTPVPATGDPRKQAILDHLQKAKANKKGWPLERVIWRAGELKIKEAAPLLLHLIGSGTPLRDYCISWALGFCGDEQAIAALNQLYLNTATPEMTRRIACEALLKLSDEETRAAFCDAQIDSLPPELSFLARQGTATDFEGALTEYLQADDAARFAVLETIYLIDNANVRPALLNVFGQSPVKPPYFRAMRHIFKAAEYRRDAEVFGLLAYRFEKSRANFTTWQGLDKDSRYPMYVRLGSVYSAANYVQNARQEIQSPTSRIAYGSRTRAYLRRRIWRTLSRLGALGDLDYVKMAVGVLLPFSDRDAQAVKESPGYDPQSRTVVKTYWDSFAAYWALNHILYHHSPRYVLRSNTKAWRCKPPYKPGDAAPAMREEAFPQLWEQRPEGLLHLIAESDCTPVLEFATRTLASCKDFCARLDTATVLMILGRPYACTARLGFGLAKQRYNALAPDRTLTLALAGCALEEARAEAHRWIARSPGSFASDAEFIAALVFNAHADTRAFARNWLQSISLPAAFAGELIDKLIARLQSLASAQTDIARDAGDTLLKVFAARLRNLSMNAILALLAHEMLEVQELGGTILLSHETPAKELPEAIINSLIASPFESLRGIGLNLFGQLEDETLIHRDAIIAAFAMHELADVRERIRPVIRRLCLPPDRPDPRDDFGPPDPVIDALTTEQREAFALRLAGRFLEALLNDEPHAGVHSDVARIMTSDMGAHWKNNANTGTAWKLIHAVSPAAQELGGSLLEFKANADYRVASEMDFSELVELSNHEILSIRQASWAIFAKMLHRLQHAMNPNHHLAEMTKAIKLLDTTWDDSRGFWFQLFDIHFTAKDFTPAILVSICDSVRKDVQAFGRKLITRFFAEEDGQEYLLKLSEHPSAELQLFATNYLERYASDNPARLAELKPYFLSVLARVNRARVAKDRVLAFLASEAQKDETAAQLVTEILTRQAVTIARGDRAAAIEALLAIHRAFPQLATPLKVKQPEVRHAF